MAADPQAADVAALSLIITHVRRARVELGKFPARRDLDRGHRRALGLGFRTVGRIVRRWPLPRPEESLLVRRHTWRALGKAFRGSKATDEGAARAVIEGVLQSVRDLCMNNRLRSTRAWLKAPDGITEKTIKQDASAIARHYRLCQSDVEVIAHDTFTRFYVNGGLTDNPRAYARRIARNLCTDRLPDPDEIGGDALDTLGDDPGQHCAPDAGANDERDHLERQFQIWKTTYADPRGVLLLELEFFQDYTTEDALQHVFQKEWPRVGPACIAKLRKELDDERAAFDLWAGGEGEALPPDPAERFVAWCGARPQKKPTRARTLLRRIVVEGEDEAALVDAGARERFEDTLRTAKHRALVNYRNWLFENGYRPGNQGDE